MREDTTIPVTALILAGGESRRMAVPKAFLMVGGLTVIEREISALSAVFDEVLVVGGDPVPLQEFGVRTVPDLAIPNGARGPLVGMYSGLMAAANDCSFVVGCDMPFIVPGLAAFLAGLRDGCDLVIPRIGAYVEPLFGVYRKTALKAIEAALERGDARLRGIFGDLDVRYVVEEELRAFDPALESFINVNTPADLEMAGRMEEKRCSEGE